MSQPRPTIQELMKRPTQALAESQGLSGIFKTTVQVGGQDLVVTGKVIDGVVHIGTFWPPVP